MKKIVIAVAMLVMSWVASMPATAQGLNTQTTISSRTAEADLVRSWYRDYLGREPGPELTAWVELLRGGMSPIDVQATILGSDEFYNQKGRDPQTWVLETLQAVTWQEPPLTILRQWTDRLTTLRGDRFALSREILQAQAQINSGSSSTAPAAATDIAMRIASASRLLLETGDFELAGTQQGRQLNLRSRAVESSANELVNVLRLRSYQPSQLSNAVIALERAIGEVQNVLSNPTGTAPSTSALARRISTLTSDLRLSISGQTDMTPVNPLPGYQTYDQQQLLSQLETVRRASQSVLQLFTAQSSTDYNARLMTRDLESFAASADALDRNIRGGTSLQRLSWDLDGIRQQATVLRPRLLEGRPPVFTRLYWSSVESGLAQMADTIARATGTTSPITSPGGGLTPVNPAGPSVTVVPLVDQAVMQVDAFLVATGPLVFGIPDVPLLQKDIRTLRNHLMELRQMAAENRRADQLAASLEYASADLDIIDQRWTKIAGDYRLVNPIRLTGLADSLTKIDTAIRATASSSGVLKPDLSSRVSLLVSTLDRDLASFKTTLAPFANYPEFRSMQLFLEQMNGYTKSLAQQQQLVQPDPSQQLRLAAGMIRQVELISTYTDRLSERAKAANNRDAVAVASNLQQRVRQINDLVIDLERELR